MQAGCVQTGQFKKAPTGTFFAQIGQSSFKSDGFSSGQFQMPQDGLSSQQNVFAKFSKESVLDKACLMPVAFPSKSGSDCERDKGLDTPNSKFVTSFVLFGCCAM